MTAERSERQLAARTLSTLLVQAAPVPRDVGANVDRIRRVLIDYPGAQLAVLPELFVSGYESERLDEVAIAVDGSVVQELRSLCHEHRTALIAGYVEQGERRPYNSMILIDRDGHIAGNYRKTHLFGAEQAAFEPGDRLECVTLGGALIAPMICFEIEIPEVARRLCAQEPDLMVSIAANMDPYLGDHTLASRARALDNRTPHVYVNRVGSAGAFDFVGGSRVVDCNGQILVDLGPTSRTTIVDVPLRVPAPDDVEYRQHLRPNLYSIPVGAEPAECRRHHN
jgi:predicted amidohydrolase